MIKIMLYNDYDENKVFFNPGDTVTIKHNIENKPEMFVVEKVVRSMVNKETQEMENVFLGIKCRWFDKNQVMHEELFSTKDLLKL